jgi:hypothetical protein
MMAEIQKVASGMLRMIIEKSFDVPYLIFAGVA